MANVSAFTGAMPVIPGGTVELASASITSPITVASNSYGAGTTIAGPLTFVSDGSPVLVEFFCQNLYASGAVASDACDFAIWVDGVETYRYWARRQAAADSGDAGGFSALARITPSSGSHTIELRAVSYPTASRWVVNAGVGGTGVAAPAVFRVSKIVNQNDGLKPFWTPPVVTQLPSQAAVGDEVYFYSPIVGRYFHRRWDGTNWAYISPSVLQLALTQHSSATQNGGAGSNYSIYAGLTTSITTHGNSRIVVDGCVGSIQPSTANSMGIVKCDYDNASTDPAVVTNMIAGTSAEWSHNGYDLKNMPFSGQTGTLAAGTYTFRVKVRSPQAVTLQWNWHSYSEQRSWLKLTEIPVV